MVRRNIIHITEDNYEQYCIDKDTLPTLDLGLTGNLIMIDSLPDGVGLILPSVTDYQSPNKKEYIKYARSFIGTSVIVYNNVGEYIPITGSLVQKGSNAMQSFALPHGEMAEFVCKLQFTNNGIEETYWEYIRGRFQRT